MPSQSLIKVSSALQFIAANPEIFSTGEEETEEDVERQVIVDEAAIDAMVIAEVDWR